ncbi:MAG: acyltransferase [Gemmatimonadota bacterium]|nr:acyltransferase [Gemmatimonadota bacterium]
MLRLLAVLLVIGRHITGALEPAASLRHPLVATWARGGWVGVDIFFVLSGFLVSGLLFTEFKARGRMSTVRFYVRRAWKIYPAFYLLLVVTVAMYAAFGQELRWSWLLSETLFAQSYVPGLWMHTWSLAIEEHFYLLLPLVLLLLVRRKPAAANPFRPMPYLGLAVILLELALRLVNWRTHSAYAYDTHLSPTHLRLDSLFVGVVLSYAYHFHTGAFVETLTPWRWALIASGAALLAPAFVFPLETTPLVYTAGFALFGAAGALLVAGTVLCASPRERILAPLAALGAHSYSIYLWHLPVMLWGIPLAEQAAGFRFSLGFRGVLSVIGSLAFGTAMARLVEAPALRLRDRWFPSRASGMARPSQASRASATGAMIDGLRGWREA